MITLQVNGESKSLKKTSSVAEALIFWGYRQENIAIAINSEFVPRSLYVERQLQQNDLVDIVTPIQGG